MTDFDPAARLIKLKGKDYLEVRWRICWLRDEHPDATITTELIERDDSSALFRATVSVPNGGTATGWGSETRQDFGDFIEKAETKSVGRALAHLGYGTAFAVELDEGGAVADAPVERKATAPAPTTPAPSGQPERTQRTDTARTDERPIAAPLHAMQQNAAELGAAQAEFKAAMKQEGMEPEQVVEVIQPVWPHIQRAAHLGTLTAAQLRLATGVLKETHHVAKVNTGWQIVAGPQPPAPLDLDDLPFDPPAPATED